MFLLYSWANYLPLYILCPGFGIPPSIVIQPKDDIVHEGVFYNINGTSANLILHCGTMGSPKPLISWFVEDNDITDQGTLLSNGTFAFNVTPGVDVTRRGMPYHCKATNMLGRKNATVARARSMDSNVSYACMFKSLCTL